MRALVLLLVMLAGPVSAADWAWTREDTLRTAAGTALTLIDWGQTNDIVARDDRVELNPILGPHPSRVAVRDYFLGVLVLHPLVSWALPAQANLFGYRARPRVAWQYLYLGVEGAATLSNLRGGLKIRF